jgi:hypothetical protein
VRSSCGRQFGRHRRLDDPMIVLARSIDDDARVLRKPLRTP